MGIFTKRTAFKPFEYPDVIGFVDAINHSYWLHTEWNFIADIQDFNTKLSEKEKNAIKNAMLAISQIEVSVKSFWGKVGDRIPKPEFNAVAFTFAESEVRHERAYSHLLEVLELNHDFSLLLENPVIQGRIDYLTKYLKGAADNSQQAYTLTLTLFSLFIENVSLFSQFALIKSFNKFRNVLKDIDNVVQATQQEETLHAMFGAYVVNQIKEENPEWFDEEFYAKIKRACLKAYDAESKIIDWMFEQGDLEFISSDDLKTFIRDRFNQSLIMIGCEPLFDIHGETLSRFDWFYEEINSTANIDFFNKKSVNYSKKTQPVTAEDLF
jgi:ribonucleoside-diphosphate reductase beta chain